MNGNNDNLLDRAEVDLLMRRVYEEHEARPKDVKIDAGAAPGDGYMSYLTRVDVTTDDGRELHVVMKVAPRSEQFRQVAPVHDAFLREMLFYEDVVPTFRQFQTVTRPVREPFDATARYYHACKDDSKEVLVMENIKTNGFKLWDRMKYMDYQHIELVLKTYGKFHSISYAMQQADPDGYAALLEKMTVDVFRLDNVGPTMLEVFTTSAAKLADLFADDVEVMEKVRTFSPIQVWSDLLSEPGNFPVICHGDCWVNNMMFKYGDANDGSKPTSICLLDFQVLRMGSPVGDLSYFFYVSAPKEFLDELDKYLRIYYDCLCSSLQEMHCTVPLTFEDLKREWKKFAVFGYNMSLIVSRVMATEADEIIDFVNANESNTFTHQFNKEFKNKAFIDNKLRQLTLHMLDNEYL